MGGAGAGGGGGGAGVGVGVASSGVASSRAQVLHETGQQIMSMAWLVHLRGGAIRVRIRLGPGEGLGWVRVKD